MVARRSCGRGLAGRHLRRLFVLSLGSREPVPAGHLHRLGRRRRVRHPPGGPGRFRLAATTRIRRSGGGPAPLRRRDWVSLAETFRHRAGRAARLYGFGASALITIQVARHWGCRVFVATRSPHEQARARALGAEWAGGYDDPPPEPLDAAITFAPSGDVVRAALRAVDRGATGGHQCHSPRSSAGDSVPGALVGTPNCQRGQLHPPRRPRAAGAGPAYSSTHELRHLPLAEANTALERLARGDVNGAAVLVVGPDAEPPRRLEARGGGPGRLMMTRRMPAVTIRTRRPLRRQVPPSPASPRVEPGRCSFSSVRAAAGRRRSSERGGIRARRTPARSISTAKT